MVARAVPARIPELPADLERHLRLAGAGRHREQDPPAPAHERLHGTVDGNLLVVPQVLAAVVVRRRQEVLGGRVVPQFLAGPQAGPQLPGRGEDIDHALAAREVVELHDTFAVGRVGKLEVENFGVVLRLLEAVAGPLVGGFRLDDCDGKVPPVAEHVVGPLAGLAVHAINTDDDAPVGEVVLLDERAWLVVPAGSLERRHDVVLAGLCLADHRSPGAGRRSVTSSLWGYASGKSIWLLLAAGNRGER
jgi:hypothetical protein